MNGVIKSGDPDTNGAVRSLFAAPKTPAASHADLRIEALERELAEARAVITRLENDLKLSAETGKAERLEALQEGIAEGLERAEDRNEQLSQRLDAAATDASRALAEAAETLSQLASDVATLALSRVVGDPSAYRDLIAATVDRTVYRLVTDAEIVVEVSAEDFPDGDVSLLAIDSGPSRRVESLAGLPSGACRLRLLLGTVDLSLPGQLDRLRDRLATAGTGPS